MVSRRHYARMDIQYSGSPRDSYAEKKGPASYVEAMARLGGGVGRAASQEARRSRSRRPLGEDSPWNDRA